MSIRLFFFTLSFFCSYAMGITQKQFEDALGDQEYIKVKHRVSPGQTSLSQIYQLYYKSGLKISADSSFLEKTKE